MYLFICFQQLLLLQLPFRAAAQEGQSPCSKQKASLIRRMDMHCLLRKTQSRDWLEALYQCNNGNDVLLPGILIPRLTPGQIATYHGTKPYDHPRNETSPKLSPLINLPKAAQQY